MNFVLPAALLSAVVFLQAGAADSRFELGERTRAVERAWIECNNSARRAMAVGAVNSAVGSFFTGRFGNVAKHLDEAMFTLKGATPSVNLRFARSLLLRADRAVCEPDSGNLNILCEAFYDLDAEVPNLTIQVNAGSEILTFQHPARASCAVPVSALAAGDSTLAVRILDAAGAVLEERKIYYSKIERFGARVEALEAIARIAPGENTDAAEFATYTEWVRMLRRAATERPETRLPVAALLTRAEAAAKAILAGRPVELRKAGDHYISFGKFKKTPPGAPRELKYSAPARVWISSPESTTLVIALHGAGGSENMFMDAYGDGMLRAICSERGWNLVCPNVNAAGARLGEVLDGLAAVAAPKASRVLLLGHSMGAMAAVSLLQQRPDHYKYVALLSGAGLADLSKLKDVNFFVTSGTQDFARAQSDTFAKQLIAAGAQVRHENYEAEHLLVVPCALPDIAAWFAAPAPKSPAPQTPTSSPAK